jgi:hypothetical protein
VITLERLIEMEEAYDANRKRFWDLLVERINDFNSFEKAREYVECHLFD